MLSFKVWQSLDTKTSGLGLHPAGSSCPKEPLLPGNEKVLVIHVVCCHYSVFLLFTMDLHIIMINYINNPQLHILQGQDQFTKHFFVIVMQTV